MSLSFNGIAMDQYASSCREFRSYPQNLTQRCALSYSLAGYIARLESHSQHLFQDERVEVDILDYRELDNRFRSACVKNQREMELMLSCKRSLTPEDVDPTCRFIFLTAGQSRAPLRITHNMFSLLCTAYQVPPSFLDCVLPFGLKEEAKDFDSSGLKGEYRLASNDKTYVLPKLDRSGRNLCFSYTLRSVEPTSRRSKEPWSIRQCAVYHTFDVENGKMLWIIVKGNKEIQTRVTKVSKGLTDRGDPLKSRSDSFATSLETHLLLCYWSGENWRSYINDFEDHATKLAPGLSASEVERDPSPLSSPALPEFTSVNSSAELFNLSQANTRTQSYGSQESPETCASAPTGNTDQPCSSWASSPKKSALAETRRWRSSAKHSRGPLAKPSQSNAIDSRLSPGYEKTLTASPEAMTSPKLPSTFLNGILDKKSERLTYNNLQTIQHIEEKAQEAVLVLKLNTEVLEHLRLHYNQAVKHADFPQDVKNECRASLHSFTERIVGAEEDMHMLRSRTEKLLLALQNELVGL